MSLPTTVVSDPKSICIGWTGMAQGKKSCITNFFLFRVLPSEVEVLESIYLDELQVSKGSGRYWWHCQMWCWFLNVKCWFTHIHYNLTHCSVLMYTCSIIPYLLYILFLDHHGLHKLRITLLKSYFCHLSSYMISSFWNIILVENRQCNGNSVYVSTSPILTLTSTVATVLVLGVVKAL